MSVVGANDAGVRLRHLHHGPPASGKINVTPLIDVVMVLIVFYLIVGKLAADRQAPVQLPEAAVGESSDRPGLVLTAAAPGPRWIVAGREVTDPAALDQAIRDALQGRDPAREPAVVRADRTLTYGELAPLLDACRRVGLTRLTLAAARANPGPEGAP